MSYNGFEGNSKLILRKKGALFFPEEWKSKALKEGTLIDHFWLGASREGLLTELTGRLMDKPNSKSLSYQFSKICDPETEKLYSLNENNCFQLDPEHLKYLKVKTGDALTIIGNADRFHIMTPIKWAKFNHFFSSPRGIKMFEATCKNLIILILSIAYVI